MTLLHKLMDGSSTGTDLWLLFDQCHDAKLSAAIARLLTRTVRSHSLDADAVRWAVCGSGNSKKLSALGSLVSAWDVKAWRALQRELSVSERPLASVPWSATIDACARQLDHLATTKLATQSDDVDDGDALLGARRRALVCAFLAPPTDVDADADVMLSELEEPFRQRHGQLASVCAANGAAVLFVVCGDDARAATLRDNLDVIARRYLCGCACRLADVVALDALDLFSSVAAPLKRVHVAGCDPASGACASLQLELCSALASSFPAAFASEWTAVAAISVSRVLPLLPLCAPFACVKPDDAACAVSFAALINSLHSARTCLLLAAGDERSRQFLLLCSSGSANGVAFLLPESAPGQALLFHHAKELARAAVEGGRAQSRPSTSTKAAGAASVLVAKKLTRAEQALFARNRVVVVVPTATVEEESADDVRLNSTCDSPTVGSPARRRSTPRVVRRPTSLTAGARLVSLYVAALCVSTSNDMRSDVQSLLQEARTDGAVSDVHEFLRASVLRNAAALRAAHERHVSAVSSEQALSARHCFREVQLQCVLRFEHSLASGAPDPLERPAFDEIVQLLAMLCFKLDSESADGRGFRVWLANFTTPYLAPLPVTLRGVYAYFELDAPDAIARTQVPYALDSRSPEQRVSERGGARPLADVIRKLSVGRNQRKREVERSKEVATNPPPKKSNVVLVPAPKR
jgi:hypothetical protein